MEEIWSNSDHTKIAAYLLFTLSGIGAGIAYLTGESAEEIVKDMQGVSENIIEQHEDFALYALTSIIVLSIFSMVSLVVTYKKYTLFKSMAGITLFVSLVSFALVVRTGYLGGQIRHSEITTGAVQNEGGQEEDDDD